MRHGLRSLGTGLVVVGGAVGVIYGAVCGVARVGGVARADAVLRVVDGLLWGAAITLVLFLCYCIGDGVREVFR
jgi:hypothetical protein